VQRPEPLREPDLELLLRVRGKRLKSRLPEKDCQYLGLARRDVALDERLNPRIVDFQEPVGIARRKRSP